MYLGEAINDTTYGCYLVQLRSIFNSTTAVGVQYSQIPSEVLVSLCLYFFSGKKEIKWELYYKIMLMLFGYSMLQAVLCDFPNWTDWTLGTRGEGTIWFSDLKHCRQTWIMHVHKLKCCFIRGNLSLLHWKKVNPFGQNLTKPRWCPLLIYLQLLSPFFSPHWFSVKLFESTAFFDWCCCLPG